MSYPEINTLASPLSCLPINKPVISYSTYIRNKHKDLDCDYWKIHLFDGCIEFNPQYFYGIFNHPKINVPSSATLSAITSITNKYLADKRIYIPVSLEKPNYYYFVARGSGKSIRELCYVAKVMSNHSSHMLSTTYSSEYKTQNYKSDMENLYKDKILAEWLGYAIKGIQELHKQNKQQQKRIEYLESQLKNK